MLTKQEYKLLLSQQVISELEKRNIQSLYCATKEEALQKVLEMIPNGSSVSCGGSATLHEIGIMTALNEGDYYFINPNEAEGGKAKEDAAHQALGVDYYLMSANAISASGELVNLDGSGNRVAALTFGPKKVIVIAGMNKVMPNLDSAVLRAKEVAAPQTIMLFKKDSTSLHEAKQIAEAAYSHLVITSRSALKGRIYIVLVGEELGF